MSRKRRAPHYAQDLGLQFEMILYFTVARSPWQGRAFGPCGWRRGWVASRVGGVAVTSRVGGVAVTSRWRRGLSALRDVAGQFAARRAPSSRGRSGFGLLCILANARRAPLLGTLATSKAWFAASEARIRTAVLGALGSLGHGWSRTVVSLEGGPETPRWSGVVVLKVFWGASRFFWGRPFGCSGAALGRHRSVINARALAH
jgi:hypothetical protein